MTLFGLSKTSSWILPVVGHPDVAGRTDADVNLQLQPSADGRTAFISMSPANTANSVAPLLISPWAAVTWWPVARTATAADRLRSMRILMSGKIYGADCQSRASGRPYTERSDGYFRSTDEAKPISRKCQFGHGQTTSARCRSSKASKQKKAIP